jgi:signal transduction histidine kinase
MQLGLAFEHKLKEERKLMVDMLTHELKNPLASISLAIGSLSNIFKDGNSMIERRLRNIDQSVRSMDAVIERCNLMNQLDQSALTYNAERIDLRQAIEEVLQRSGQRTRVALSIDSSSYVVTDLQFFQMIVSNLIDNALKYSPDTTTVHVCVHREKCESPEQLIIEVSNQISAKGAPDPKLVFTRFYRHTMAHDTSGSGVGLYLAQTLARLMGGRIVYEPTPGHVVFRVWLPQGSIDE